MAQKKGKRRNHGRRRLLRSPAATARRRMRGGERLRRAFRGLLARQPVRRVLVAWAAQIFFQVDIPEALAPAVLRDAAFATARRLHGEQAQPFRFEGTQGQADGAAPHVLAQVAVGVQAGRRALDDKQALPA